MTSARAARRQAVLAARAGATVRGPILAPLRCGCVIDDAGGLWQPCGGIEDAHSQAVQYARYGWARHCESPDELAAVMATIAAHVEAGERAAHGMAEQAVML